jgi:rubredoxin
MDMDFVEQLICSDCGLVYGEMLAFESQHGAALVCPRCGAGDGAVTPIAYIYGLAQASLNRF